MKRIVNLVSFGQVLKVLVTIWGALSGTVAIIWLLQLTLGESDALGLLEALAILPFLFLTLILMVAALVWWSQVVRNARIEHPKAELPSVAWAVVAFLIPIVNFIAPFFNLTKVAKAMDWNTNQKQRISTWWTVVVLSEGSSFLADAITGSTGYESLITDSLSLFSSALGPAIALLSYKLISNYSGSDMER